MPRVGEPIRPEPEPKPDPRLVERTEFESGFQRSGRGNLWRYWEDRTVSVFKRRDDRYGWCIASGDYQKEWAPESYESEDDALGALRYALGVGL